MADKKEPLAILEDVYYKPCKNCGSLDYDHADGEPIERPDNMYDFEPKTCDVCGYGNPKCGTIAIH